ncbi:hypothetical protein QOL99_01660 [Deinococcus sp. MIMF12]|uniref:HEAT repeat domain-containing protein n=1 Tax=Deinococcus rhizophilus TaxID=3049544 RepID=A0ABT7JCT8_9DEIO|nr:hypothetical protein [Deinococcus rhizophilus]MDL2342847.1 hypothetical protein [Deinococcus rhizophilus]
MTSLKFSDVIDVPDGPDFDVLRDQQVGFNFQERSRILKRSSFLRWQPRPLEKRSLGLRSMWVRNTPEEVLAAFLQLAPRAGDLRLWAYDHHEFTYEPLKSFDEVIKQPDFRTPFIPLEEAEKLRAHFKVTRDQALEVIGAAVQGRYPSYRIPDVHRIDLFKDLLPEDFFATGQVRENRLRLLLARARATPAELLQELLEDEDQEVELAAVINPNSRPSAQQMLEAYHRTSTEDSGLPDSPLGMLSGENSQFFGLLSRPDFPFEQLLGAPVPEGGKLRVLADSDLPPVRMYVASMKTAPLEVKLSLARREGDTPEQSDIKTALAYASVGQPEVLRVLMQDQDESVRRVSTGAFIHHTLTHIDTLSSYGATMSWQQDLADPIFMLYREIPDIDSVSTRGYTLNFQATPYGFHVLPDGQAKVYLNNSYKGHETEDEDEDLLWTVSQSYDSDEWDSMMVRALEKNDSHTVVTTFPLTEALTQGDLNSSGTQFDERIITALITHGLLDEAVTEWLDHVFNFDVWSLVLRPFRVMGTYQPQTRERFETALAVPAYFKAVECGLKYGFGRGDWDKLDTEAGELLAASDFARRHGQATLADAVADLARR